MSDKPIPSPTPETAPYWDGCKAHKLLLQRCAACSAWQFYPRSLCSACAHGSLAWAEASGRGVIESFTVVRRAIQPGYAPEVPYAVGLIRLAEGPVMMTNVVESALDALAVGAAVEVVFEDRGEAVVPQFRLVAE